MLDQRPELAFCAATASLEDPDGKPVGTWACQGDGTASVAEVFAAHALIAGALRRCSPGASRSRRSAVSTRPLFGAEDTDLWIRLAACGGFACIPRRWWWCARPGSVSRNCARMRAGALAMTRKNRHLLPADKQGAYWRALYAARCATTPNGPAARAIAALRSPISRAPSLRAPVGGGDDRLDRPCRARRRTAERRHRRPQPHHPDLHAQPRGPARTRHRLARGRPPACRLARPPVRRGQCLHRRHARIPGRAQRPGRSPRLVLIAEPTPGNAHALNRALPLMEDELVAFVDDDHRVTPTTPARVTAAAERWPEADLFCGRIVLDWDGSEPAWFTTKARIASTRCRSRATTRGWKTSRSTRGAIPGGGNLVARLPVIGTTGPFAIELGPTGHDLGGSEDADWILRALRNGARLHYAPQILQHHYVDSERLTLSYVARKGYQRSQSVTRVRAEFDRVPRYMWRKAAGYALGLAFSWRLQARRFYLVRLASSMGEISASATATGESGGVRHCRCSGRKRDRRPVGGRRAHARAGGGARAPLAGRSPARRRRGGRALTSAVLVAVGAGFLAHRAGPARREILARYRGYVVSPSPAWGRGPRPAAFWPSPAPRCGSPRRKRSVGNRRYGRLRGGRCPTSCSPRCMPAAALSQNPGLVIASWQYRTVRIHRLGVPYRSAVSTSSRASCWRPNRPGRGDRVAALPPGRQRRRGAMLLVTCGYIAPARLAIWGARRHAGPPPPTNGASGATSLMIGSDTLRADRIGARREGASITRTSTRWPHEARRFGACYVPCARTAPSLISLFTRPGRITTGCATTT